MGYYAAKGAEAREDTDIKIKEGRETGGLPSGVAELQALLDHKTDQSFKLRMSKDFAGANALEQEISRITTKLWKAQKAQMSSQNTAVF